MTLQKRDKITYNGDEYLLDRDIMSSYFESHPDRKPPKIGFNSNLHRGYFAEFEIIDGQLFVTDFSAYTDYDRATLEEISSSFLAFSLSDIRHCQWFSGPLILFSQTTDPEKETKYVRLEIKEGNLEKVEFLTKAQYDNLGNHAYDYF